MILGSCSSMSFIGTPDTRGNSPNSPKPNELIPTVPGVRRPVAILIRCFASAPLAPPVSKVPMGPRGVEAEPHRCPWRLPIRTVKRVFPWTRSSSCETPVSPTGVSLRFSDARRSPPYGVAATGTETGQRSRASQDFRRYCMEQSESKCGIRRYIDRSQRDRLADARPWAAGLSILEVDPVASEAVEVLLLSSVPPDGDLSGALKVQKTPVRVQAAAELFKPWRLRTCRGNRKFRFGSRWGRRIMGIVRDKPTWRWRRNRWHTTDQQPKRYPKCPGKR